MRKQDGDGSLMQAGGFRLGPGNGASVVGALGEGLLEVGLDPTLPDDLLGRGFGGDAANAAVMAARMGARARLLTRVGDDAAGRLLLAHWREQRVGLDAVTIDAAASTGLYINERDAAGAHRFSYHRLGSAASALTADDADERALRGLAVLHVTGITLSISASAAQAAEAAARRARALGAAVSFAVNYRAPLTPDRERLLSFARAADVLFLSVEDARSLFAAERLEEVVAALGGGPGEIVMTRGAEEAVVLAGGGRAAIAPPPVTAVDAAGAGDAVAGAYLAMRAAGHPPSRALAYGVVAGTLSCRFAGCSRSYPSAAEVETAVRALEGPVTVS
jgi:2-dehydro-3-deoxygluconokinase